VIEGNPFSICEVAGLLPDLWGAGGLESSDAAYFPESFLELPIVSIVRPMLREAEDDACGDAEGVLNIGRAVRKMGAKPIGLEGADREVARQPDVDAAAYLQGEGVIVGQRSGRGGKAAVGAMGLTDKSLAKDGKALLPRTSDWFVPRVTWAEGSSDHRQPSAAVSGVAYVCSSDVGRNAETTIRLCRKFDASALLPEGRVRNQVAVLHRISDGNVHFLVAGR